MAGRGWFPPAYGFTYVATPNQICVEIELFGHSRHSSTKIIAAVDYSSEVTQISRRLYDDLGYPSYGQKVLVVNDVDIFTPYMSIFPMTVRCNKRMFANYPFINSLDEDEYYEMIIGQDLISQNPTFYKNFSWPGQPSPGPAFDPFRMFCSRNIRLGTSGKHS